MMQDKIGTCQESDTPATRERSLGVLRGIADHPVANGVWGHTYFVRRGDAIKIGHSAIPKQRISALQVSFPEPLEVLAVLPNTAVSEAAAHEAFAHLRMSGEWFRAEPELIEFIAQAKAQATRAAKAHPPIRIVPQIDPTITRLLKLRNDHGPDTQIGNRCSNLSEAIPNFRKATDPVARANIARSISVWTNELAALLAA